MTPDRAPALRHLPSSIKILAVEVAAVAVLMARGWIPHGIPGLVTIVIEALGAVLVVTYVVLRWWLLR